jgi:hypothetical protein
MFGSGALPQARNGGADVAFGGFQIGQDQHRLGLFRALYQPVGIRNRLDAIIYILKPVDELAAWQQLLI